MKQPKLHITDVVLTASYKEAKFSLDLDGLSGKSVYFEDASRGESVPVSLDGGKTWAPQIEPPGGNFSGHVRLRSISDDGAVFCYITLQDGSSVVSAALIRSRKSSNTSNFNITCNPQFVTMGDSCMFKVSGPSTTSFRIGIGEMKYGGRTNRQGNFQIKLTASQIFSNDQLSARSLVRVPVKLSVADGAWSDVGSDVHFVPSSLRTLAATNDPQTPACVILDPQPNPDQGLRFSPQEAPCSDLALVGPLYDPSGTASSQKLTYLDAAFTSVGEGYSRAVKDSASDCTPLDHVSSSAAWFDSVDQSFGSVFPTTEIDDRGLSAFSKGAWHAFSEAHVEVPPSSSCTIANTIETPVARIIVAKSSPLGKANPKAVARGIIKKPPLFTHSVVPLTTIPPNPRVSVVFRLEDGSEISLDLPWTTDEATTLPLLVTAINDEATLKQFGISAEYTSGRVDVSSERRFSLLAGQVFGSTGSPSNAIQVFQFSGASASFRSITIRDLSVHGVSNTGKLVFLNGVFRGTIFDYTKTSADTVKLSACPGINKPGGIYITDDIPCLHVAFLGTETTGENPSVSRINLPIRRDSLNQPISCVSPSVSQSCRVVCQSQVDGKNQLFMFSECPISQDAADAGTWLQLTTDGDNRNPQISEDRFGNLHLVWNRDFGNGTFVAYGTIGADSSLYGIKALVADFHRSHLDSNPPVINEARRGVSTFDIANGQNLLEMPYSSSNLRRGAYPSTQTWIRREFLGRAPVAIAFPTANPNSFSNQIKNSSGAVVPLAGVTQGQILETLILHIDPSANSGAVTYKGTVSFGGQILAIAGQNDEMSSTDALFSPSGIVFPNRSAQVSFGGMSFVITPDKKSITFSVPTAPANEPFELRFLVAAESAAASVRGSWIKLADAGSAVAMPRQNSICLDYSPQLSKCASITQLYSDDSGRGFDGSHKSIGYSVGADISIQPSITHDSHVIAGGGFSIRPVIGPTLPTTGVSMRTEFFGAINFSRTPITQSTTGSGTIFLDNSIQALAGFSNGDVVAAHLVAIPPAGTNPSISASIVFSADILSVETSRAGIIVYHPLVSNYALPTPFNNAANTIVYRVSGNGRQLDIAGSSTPGEWIFALVFTAAPSHGSFLRDSSADAIEDAFKSFTKSFIPRADGLFDLGGNIFSVGKSGSEFSDFIPILSSARLNDIHVNPDGLPQSAGLGFISPGGSNSFSLLCSDVIGQFYQHSSGATVTRPAADGADGIIYHYILGVQLETVRFFARNVETKTDWCTRLVSKGDSCLRYYEGLISTCYTGRARLCCYMVSSEATQYNGGVPFSFERLDSDHVFNIGGNFRLDLTSYVKKDTEHSIRTSRAHLDPLRSEEPENTLSLVSRSHRCAIFASVNGVASLACDWRVDLSDSRRQFDLCFGSMLSSSAWFRHEDCGYRNSLVSQRMAVIYSDVTIGDARMISANGSSIADGDLQLSGGFVQQNSSGELVRNARFLQSLSDPGDWINMPSTSSSIDEWGVAPGGALFSGTLFSDSFRALVLQPSTISSTPFDASIYQSANFPARYFHELRRGRIATGGPASASQSLVFLSEVDYETATGLDITNADQMLYSIYVSARRLEPLRDDGSQVCPINMMHPWLHIGGGSKSRVVQINQDSFTNKSFTGAFGTGSLHVSSFHPLYQKRAVNLAVSDSTGTEPHVMMYVNTQGVLSHQNPGLGGWVGEFMVALTGRSVVAIASNSPHALYDGTNGMYIMLGIDSAGNLFSKTRAYDVSSPNAAIKTQIQNAFSADLTSLGNSWRDISVGSTFAVGITAGGSVATIGVRPTGWVDPTTSNFVACACGQNFCLFLKDDGTLEVVGEDDIGQRTSLPTGCFLAVGAAGKSAYALKWDGSLVAWGEINGGAPADSNPNIRAFAQTEYDSNGLKACDADGLLFGNDPLVGGSTPIVGFQGPFTVFMSIPQGSRRIIKFRAKAATVGEVTDCIVDTYGDPFRANVAINKISVVPSSLAFSDQSVMTTIEDSGVQIATLSMLGTPFTTGGFSINRLGRRAGIQRNPSVCTDRLAKFHVAYESNDSGTWNINVSSLRDWDRGLSRVHEVSSRRHLCQNSSIACDANGHMLVAWNERSGGSSRIAASVSRLSDPDFADSCAVDRAAQFIRTFDADPYDPAMPPRIFSCDISSYLSIASTGTYKFDLKIFDVSDGTILFQSSSAENPVGWYLNGNTLSSEGQALLSGSNHVVSFDAVPDDIRSRGILRWMVSAEPQQDMLATETISFVSAKSSANVQQLIPGSGGNTPQSIRAIIEGEIGSASSNLVDMFITQEQSGVASVAIPPRSFEDYAGLSFGNNTSNVSFPEGVVSLPGIGVGKQYRSFLIHAPVQVKDSGVSRTVDEFVGSTITFNAPIVAIMVSPSDLSLTDSPFGYPATTWGNAGERAVRFEDGEYIVLSANLRTVDVRLKRKPQSPGVNHVRIVTSIGEASAVSGNGYLFCHYPSRPRCALPAFFTNLTTVQKLVHFRVTIYSDSEKQNAVAVFTSRLHPSFWDAGRGSYPSGGVACAPQNSVSVSFVPRIAPSDSVQGAFGDIDSSFSSESNNLVVGNLVRNSLMPNTTYYAWMEAEVDTGFTPLQTSPLPFACSGEFGSRYDELSWSGVDGKYSYLTPANGFCRYPSACGTDLGLFYIAWQDGRSNVDYRVESPDRFRSEARFAFYDSSTNRWSSVDGEGGARFLYE